jgi:hypothetical protein
MSVEQMPEPGERISDPDVVVKAILSGSRIIGEHWFFNLPWLSWRLKVRPD